MDTNNPSTFASPAPDRLAGLNSAWRLRTESDALRHLDVVRFVAAMLVVVYHYRNQWWFGDTLGRELLVFRNLSLAVDVFFVISGIVISFVYADRFQFGRFIRARFARLAPLHYATLFAYVGIGLLAAKLGIDWAEAGRVNGDCLVPSFTMTHSVGPCDHDAFNHVSWSISAEMIVYLLFPLAVLVPRRSAIVLTVLAVVMLAVLYAAGPLGPQQRPWHELTYDFGVLRAIVGFLVGIALYQNRARLALLPAPRLLLVLAVGAFFVGLATDVPRGLMLLDAYLIAAFAYAADLRQTGTYWLLRIAPLSALTYGVYMLHPLVRTLFLPVQTHFGVPVNVAIVVNTAIVVALAWASYVLFERPARRMINGGAKPRTLATAL